MTPVCIAFFKYSTVKSRIVEIANRALMPGVGLGKVKLSVSVDRRTRSIVLTNVLYIPQIKKNLISIARLQDKGIIVKTIVPPSRKALIIKYQGRKVDVASQIRDSFVLDIPTDRAFPVGDVTDQRRRNNTGYARWHSRFGHIGPQIVNRLYMVVDDLR